MTVLGCHQKVKAAVAVEVTADEWPAQRSGRVPRRLAESPVPPARENHHNLGSAIVSASLYRNRQIRISVVIQISNQGRRKIKCRKPLRIQIGLQGTDGGAKIY